VHILLRFVLCYTGFQGGNEAYCLSVFLVMWLLKLSVIVACRLVELLSTRSTCHSIVCSTWILPVYSHHISNGKQVLHDETATVLTVIQALSIGILWGCMIAMFLQPMSIGIVVCCCFIMVAALLSAVCSTYTTNCLYSATQVSSCTYQYYTINTARHTNECHTDLNVCYCISCISVYV
jgi:hypothetical protein